MHTGIYIGIITLIMVFYVMWVGQSVIMPFIIALFIWMLLNAMAGFFTKKLNCKKWLSLTIAILTFIAIAWVPVELITQSVPKVMEEVPNYQQNFNKLTQKFFTFIGVEQNKIIQELSANFDIGRLLAETMKGLTILLGNIVLVIVYVAFLLAEQNMFGSKISELFSTKTKQKKVHDIIGHIQARIQKYIWLKTILSLITSLISYTIMKFVGIDFAAVWAMLIFFLNFIPNIGSILATVFPALLSLVQFDSLTPFFSVLAGIGITQFIIGNVLEPKLMGNSLNLSSLIIIISLVLWGSLWGIAGTFLCVPLTVIIMIVLAEFKNTRPFAIVLSGNGKVG